MLRVALPKGRLLAQTADLLERAGWGLEEYTDKARLYRLKSHTYSDLTAKMFQEKDIPIQVAVGNYDIGICGLDWLTEQTVKFPASNIVKLKELGYGEGAVYAAASPHNLKNGEIMAKGAVVRIASEYPNLAESLAQKLRLRRFAVYSLWGSADTYPPENAEIVLLSRKNETEIAALDLRPLGKIVDFRACLIVNKDSLRSRDMSALLASLNAQISQPAAAPSDESLSIGSIVQGTAERSEKDNGLVWLALPDGHQQAHVRRILDAAGVKIKDYPSSTGNRRPESSLEGFFIKVIRPQDMPLQVANGNFDMAITGRDWLTDHLYQFPQSPVRELLDLKYGKVRIVAVVANEVPASTTPELQIFRQAQGGSCRIAAEYVNIADNYARVNHLGAYRVVPTWGATEAFLPEDADVLIENTETGSTIARHNLKIIETLFESTACLMGSSREDENLLKAERMTSFVDLLRKTMGTMK
ncbi:MAG: ATP phosphoribosyltransferase [Dehalococcoidia bacterium]|nr:MAG: ATP phosphoribosyltransferase [Dehalococcoidia bacterium]